MIHDVDICNFSQTNGDGSEFLRPDYKNFCITRIPELISILFGLESRSHQPSWVRDEVIFKLMNSPLNVVLVTIDGFGYEAWQKCFRKIPFMNRIITRGNMLPLTTVFPSTTAAALTTINTGLTPSEHGLLEFRMYMHELQRIIRPIPFCPDDGVGAGVPEYFATQSVDKRIVFSRRSVYDSWYEGNIATYRVLPDAFVDSTYTSLTQPGSLGIPYKSFSDMAVSLAEWLNTCVRQSFFHLYVPNMDACAHKYGPYSKQWEIELEMLMVALQAFVAMVDKKVAGQTIFLVTGDHGHIRVSPDETIILDDLIDLSSVCERTQAGGAIHPWGSPRSLFLKIREEELSRTFQDLRSALDGKAAVLSSSEEVDKGLFGPYGMDEKLLRRAGNVLIVPCGNNTVWYKHPNNELVSKLGMHGGMTKSEMLTVLGFANLNDLQV